MTDVNKLTEYTVKCACKMSEVGLAYVDGIGAEEAIDIYISAARLLFKEAMASGISIMTENWMTEQQKYEAINNIIKFSQLDQLRDELVDSIKNDGKCDFIVFGGENA